MGSADVEVVDMGKVMPVEVCVPLTCLGAHVDSLAVALVDTPAEEPVDTPAEEPVDTPAEVLVDTTAEARVDTPAEALEAPADQLPLR